MTSGSGMTLSIGITGSTDLDVVRRIAPLVEQAGYRALWVNDMANGDSLDVVAAAAETTSTLGLATGVIPLDRQDGAAIAARVRDLGMPAGRLRIGIGSGGVRRGALASLEAGVAELREGCDAPVVIGALGPRTRALAARVADGILFNWLTPAAATDAMATLREDAAGRRVEGILYTRTVASPDARATLESEAARYASIRQYGANFGRLGMDPLDSTIDLNEPGSLDRFGMVDELVLRVVTATGSEAELVEVIEAGATGF